MRARRQNAEVGCPRIVSGEAMMTTADCEPNGGLRLRISGTRITPAGNGFAVDGTKLFVRDAGTAEAIICLAPDRRRAKRSDIAVVPRDAPGVKLRRMQAAGGEALWEVILDGVNVDADAVVGEVGGLGPMWRDCCCAVLHEIGRACRHRSGVARPDVELCQERVQFGRPIGSFQGVHHHCAEMYRDLEVSRSTGLAGSCARSVTA